MISVDGMCKASPAGKGLASLGDVLGFGHMLESSGKQDCQLRNCLEQIDLWGHFLV